MLSLLETGAAEESRTLDLNLGKVALYQLSYCRKTGVNYRLFSRTVKVFFKIFASLARYPEFNAHSYARRFLARPFSDSKSSTKVLTPPR